MNKNKMNISKVESYLNSIIDNVVSNNTFVGSKLPDKASIPSDWNDICLIEIASGLVDKEAFGDGTVLVWLYARPMESGKKNVAILSRMETKLNEVIANATSKDYVIARGQTYTYYEQDIDWHCNVVELLIKVF